MKILKILTLLAFFCVTFSTYAQENKKRIAVMPFDYSGQINKEEAKYLTEKVRSALIQTRQFEVISNDQIENMMAMEAKKQGVGPGSCNTEQCIIDLGNALECEKMLVGSAGEAFGEFSINAKILDVVLQQYENAADVSVNNKSDFPKAAKDVVKKLVGDYNEFSGGISYAGMIWRTVAAPGWGHMYTDQKRGMAYLGVWGVTAGVFLWSHFNYSSKVDEYAAAESDFDAKYDAANSAHSLRGYMSYILLAVYATALTDTLLTGKSYTASESHTGGSFKDSSFPIFNILPRYTYNNKAETFYEMAIRKQF